MSIWAFPFKEIQGMQLVYYLNIYAIDISKRSSTSIRICRNLGYITFSRRHCRCVGAGGVDSSGETAEGDMVVSDTSK